MNVQIEQDLHCGTYSIADIPEVSSWDEIDWWYVKWDTLHYQLKRENTGREISLSSDTGDIIDWKRPTAAWVYELDEDGDQTGEVLSETG